ncbi:AAA family ATPase [Heyndrickxia sporothermodurans]
MKIKEVHIYGYGKWSNLQLPILRSIQVLYGENEAGKSTLMSFIHGILFGFPTKQQSELRYEPKSISKYGGNLTIETDEYGDIWIERVNGKASGDVTVRFSDGTFGGEDLLKEKVITLDKVMYKSIFSFNIHGLQGVNRLKGDEIGKYLLAAGTIGTDTVIKTEVQLQKEMDQLFKPNGRKPELNEMLAALKEQEKDIKNSMKHNQSYGKLQVEHENLSKDMKRLHSEITELQKELHKLEQWRKEWPLIQERKRIHLRMDEIGACSFPVDGIKRIEKLEEQIRIADNQLTVLTAKRNEIDKEIQKVMPNERIEMHEESIQLLIERWTQVLQWQEEIIRRQEEVTKWNEQISSLKREIHFQDEDIDNLSLLDLSIDMKDRIRTAIKDYYYLKSQEAECNKQIELEKRKLNELEKQCESIEANLISEEEFRRLSDHHQKYIRLQTEYEKLNEQMKFIELSNGTTQKDNQLPTIFSYIIFAGFFAWSLMNQKYLLMSGAVIGIIVLSLSFLMSRRKGKQNEDNTDEQMRKKIEKISSDIRLMGIKELEFNEQQKCRQSWKEIVLQIENQQSRLKEKEEALSLWGREWNKNEEKIVEMKRQLRIQRNFSTEQLPDAFDILCELLKIVNSRSFSENQLKMIKGKVANWEKELKDLLNGLQIKGLLSVEEGVLYLKSMLKEEREKKLTYRDLISKNEDLSLECLKWTKEYDSLKTMIQALIKEANVENAEDFRRKGKENEEKSLLQANLEMLNQKLGDENGFQFYSMLSENELKSQLTSIQEKIKDKRSMIESYHKKLAEIKYEINLLEDGGSYTEKLHSFYLEKSILNKKARDWAKLALAKELIHRTMNRMKNDRFPLVLQKAEEYLRILTDGKYTRLLFQPTGHFIVERNDRITFEPEELSQATAEQIYVSFRLALVHILQNDFPFPMIIDDGFVNFDKKRTKRIVQILLEMSKTTQILFFTCHQHILELFSNNQILMLTEDQRYSMLK